MPRSAQVPLVLFLFAIPSLAQTPGRALHREIPGDLGLGALPQEAFAASSGPGSFAQSAQGTGWNQHQNPSPDVFQPREAWETTLRELDRNTHSPPNAELQYREVFTPSISPFKRAQSYDAVDELGRLTVRDPSLRVVTVNDSVAWQSEAVARFTGDVQVRLSTSTPTAVPSVAAEERLVSFTTSPSVPVVFLRDSAGSLYVRGSTETVVRLTYVIEAPQRAFVTPTLPRVPLRTRLAGTLAPIAPGWVQTTATAVLAAAQVRPDEDFATVVSGLIGYFRAFRDEDLPGNASNNLYRDLALGGVGACRHRAYAFVLTLHSLGVPARYVNNEAHAWAEVAIPEVGWTRVDLGGWNVNLRAENPSTEPGFTPSNEDPFPRPSGYDNGYSTHGASSATHRDGSTQEPQPGAATDPSADPGGEHHGPGTQRNGGGTNGGGTNGGGTNGGGTNGAPGDPSRPFTDGPSRAGTEQPMSHRTVSTDAQSQGGAQDPQPSAEMLGTTLTLATVVSSEGGSAASSVRGSLVVVEGEAHDERDEVLANLPVEVVIQSDRGASQPLGTTVTDANGRYRAQVLLPASLAPGDYALRVRTQGDSRHTPAVSN